MSFNSMAEILDNLSELSLNALEERCEHKGT